MKRSVRGCGDGWVRAGPDEAKKLGSEFCAARVSVVRERPSGGLRNPGEGGRRRVDHPGDLLHGDQHVVVVIPHEIAERIPEAAERVAADEQRIIQALSGPKASPSSA